MFNSLSISNINQTNLKIGAILSIATVGNFGAYLIRPIFASISPLGVALSCGATTAIGLRILFDNNLDMPSKFLGFLLSYPLGILAANLLGRHVHFIHPGLCFTIGAIVLTPLTLSAFALTVFSQEYSSSMPSKK